MLLTRRSDTIPPYKSGKARITTALPTGSRKTLHPPDNRHSASSAKKSDENQRAAPQGPNQDPRAVKERSAPMSVAPYPHTVCELKAGKRPDPHGDSNRRAGTVTTQRVGCVMTMRKPPTLGTGRGLPQRIPPSPKRHGRDDAKQKNAGF